eukprot:1142338-Pelagomonas_calceolata.AAC.13
MAIEEVSGSNSNRSWITLRGDHAGEGNSTSSCRHHVPAPGQTQAPLLLSSKDLTSPLGKGPVLLNTLQGSKGSSMTPSFRIWHALCSVAMQASVANLHVRFLPDNEEP